MAEVSAAYGNGETNKHEFVNNKQIFVVPSLNIFDILCILFSFGSLIADISTDIILIVDYLLSGHIGWALSTLLLLLIPASIVQFYSLRWHKLDEQISISHYISHACLLGVIHRYIDIIRTIILSRLNKNSVNIQKIFQQQNDLCTLHLFECFIESTPQIILQLYIILNSGNWNSWTGLSAITSVCSLIWAIMSYTKIRKKENISQVSSLWHILILQTTWQYSMLLARITSLVIFAHAFCYWIFIVIGLHWIGVTIWTISQNNLFPIIWEDKMYDTIVGIIYCFSYFNICEGCSRKRIFTFYLVITIENIICFILVLTLYNMPLIELIVSAVLITGGIFIGLLCLSLYFSKYHPLKTVSLCYIFHDIEASSPQAVPDNAINNTQTLRSLQHLWSIDRCCIGNQTENNLINTSPRLDDVCADKKLLLENWIARSGTPTFASVPISQSPILEQTNNDFDDIEFHTEVNTPNTTYERGILNDSYKCTENSLDNDKLNNERQKRKGICSPTELGLKLLECSNDVKDLDLKDTLTLNQKRRGICSSDQLVVDLNIADPLSCSITSSNMNDDVKLKRRPIYSVGSSNSFNSDLNSKYLYSVKLIKVIDDKNLNNNIRPEEYIEVSSEVLSAHDYENICAVNIARERWGIRSWEGYTDIETYLHDDSTVRDRRRDTLTSTVTGTSASSEISSSDIASSPPPLIPNRRSRSIKSRQDDYLDTLIYDLVDCDRKRVHFSDCNEEYEVESNVFIAKPYVVDQHGMFFPLSSSLEPIEELEEPVLTDKMNKQETRSSLVTTIDEISRGNDTDSPRHVYHRTENVWDDDVNIVNNLLNSTTKNTKMSKNVAKSLWNPTVKYNPDNHDINNRYNEKDSTDIQIIKENVRKEIESRSVENFNKINTLTTNYQTYNTEDDKLSFTQKKTNDIDHSKPRRNGNKPRRKFSLLREKFEPKAKSEESENTVDSSSFEMGSTVNLIDDLKSTKITSSVITKVVNWNNTVSVQNKLDDNIGQAAISDENSCSNIDKPVLSNLIDKRNVFLKQVLSPPKFNNWKRPVNKM